MKAILTHLAAVLLTLVVVALSLRVRERNAPPAVGAGAQTRPAGDLAASHTTRAPSNPLRKVWKALIPRSATTSSFTRGSITE